LNIRKAVRHASKGQGATAMVPRGGRREVEKGSDRLVFAGTWFVLYQCHSEDIQISENASGPANGLQHRKALSWIWDQMRDGSPNVALVRISRYGVPFFIFQS